MVAGRRCSLYAQAGQFVGSVQAWRATSRSALQRLHGMVDMQRLLRIFLHSVAEGTGSPFTQLAEHEPIRPARPNMAERPPSFQELPLLPSPCGPNELDGLQAFIHPVLSLCPAGVIVCPCLLNSCQLFRHHAEPVNLVSRVFRLFVHTAALSEEYVGE